MLLHTLFHEDPNFDKYRTAEFSRLYFFVDDIKSKGNEAYHKGDYYLAIDYYEQCLSLYNWLELRDEKSGERSRITLFHTQKDF